MKSCHSDHLTLNLTLHTHLAGPGNSRHRGGLKAEPGGKPGGKPGGEPGGEQVGEPEGGR